MANWKGTCPGCDLPLDVELSGTPCCPICNEPLPVRADVAAPPVEARALPKPEAHKRQMHLGMAVMLAVFVAATAGLVAVLSNQIPRRVVHKKVNPEPPAAEEVATPALPEKTNDQLPSPPPPLPPVHYTAVTPKPVQPNALAARVNAAIDRGVGYLQEQLRQIRGDTNYAALIGLALLECGVPATDPGIAWLADLLRSKQLKNLDTYQLSLHILFFDRLGQSKDVPLIRELASTLCRNQFNNGTWSYRQPPRPPEPPAPSPIGTGFPQPGARPRPNPFLRPNPIFRPNPQMPPRPKIEPSGDHSNTQFGALALWVASRHGVSVIDNLVRLDAHFRKIQNADGSWGYRPGSDQHKDSMTCAALMGLALGQALEQKYAKIDQVPNLPKRQVIIARGFQALAPTLNRAPAPKGGGRLLGADSMGDIYFLWSLERLAVTYNLKIIGQREWYPWAAGMLVDSQQQDGSWHDAFAGPADTSFALLILKRSNRASDLASFMRQAINQRSLTLLPGLLEMEPEVRPAAPSAAVPARESAPDARDREPKMETK